MNLKRHPSQLWQLCLAGAFALLVSMDCHADGWWPAQVMPKALVRATTRRDFPPPRQSWEMTLQSVAGLAAKAVNERRGDELVWIDTGNVDEEDWLTQLLKRHPQLEIRGAFDPWALVDHYVTNGIIKGYILYRSSSAVRGPMQQRPSLDYSVNVATSLAGILDGIIVDENLEPQAKKHGLKMLMDARDKTQDWCFESYKAQFSQRLACTQTPDNYNARDLAIAQKAFTFYGYGTLGATVMEWLEPLSPIIGWNGGDEFRVTEASSRWGHIQTSTDWCINLPVLMAGSATVPQSTVKSFDPAAIDWSDTRSAVAFVSSDGDNVQWWEGNFFRSSDARNYWSNPERGSVPFGWSCCFAHLAQLCPEAIDYAISTRSPNDWFVEWGGGYYYPDLFAADRPNRWELLAQHARRTWSMMAKNNTRIIGFNTARLDSVDALKAYQVFASQTDGLLAILVFQYDRYEAGAGKVFWVKDRNGMDVPVVSARYAIWNHLNSRPCAGTPAKVARDILQSSLAMPASEPRYDWVIAHSWSWFRRAPGWDENAEDLRQDTAAAQGGQRGYCPVTWCATRLEPIVHVVSPEELIWRIRMKHNADQTKKLIQQVAKP